MIKNYAVISIVLTFAVLPAYAIPIGASSCSVSPTNPTTDDVVSLTFSGTWSDSCKPNFHQVSFSGNTIYVDIYANYSPGTMCMTVLSPWSRTAQVGPLGQGDFQAIGRIHYGFNQLALIPPCAFTVFSADALYVTGAASRKSHGVAGDIDVPIPLGANTFIESRSGGPTTIVVSFSKNIAIYSDQPAVASTGTVTNTEAQDNQLIVSLEGVPDGSCLTLTLDVTDESYFYLIEGINHVDMRVLRGDVTQNGENSTADMLKIKSLVNAPLTNGNALCDLNLNGTITTADLLLAKSLVGHTANCP